ncbi:MAG: O-antigen ligase family protein [Patescibacteria group bacterium]
MKQFLSKITEYGFYLFLFLLPWQTRWIWRVAHLNGNIWEYGSGSLYATDILLMLLLFLAIFLPRTKVQVCLRQLWAVIGTLFFIAFMSVLWSQDKGISWYAIARLAEAIGLFWLVLKLDISWPRVGTAIASAGVVQAVFGIYQFFSQQIPANAWLGLASHQPGSLGDAVIATVEGRYLRAYGSFPHPNVLGGFLVICLFILIGFMFVLYTNRRANVWKILLTVSSLIIVSYGLILTFSRSAWLAFGVAFIVMAGLSVWQRYAYRLKLLIQVACWLIILVLMTVALVPDIWITRLTADTQLEQQSIDQRVDYFVQARNVVTEHIFQGVGLGDYTGALYDQNTTLAAWDYQPVHNIFVLAIAETGVLGGAAFILIVIEFIRMAIFHLRRELAKSNWLLVWTTVFCALAVLGLFDHYLWTLASGICMFWLALGLWARRYRDEVCG